MDCFCELQSLPLKYPPFTLTAITSTRDLPMAISDLTQRFHKWAASDILHEMVRPDTKNHFHRPRPEI
jgi:hypothetical protein